MIGGEIGRPVSNSTGPGHADADRPTAARARRASSRAAASNSSSTRSRPTSGPASIARRLVVMAEDPAVERRDRHVDARRAEVGDQDVAGVGPERQLARRPAAGARPDVALDDEPALDELADPLGDDRPAEPGPRRRARSATATARGGSRRGRATSASSASSGERRGGHGRCSIDAPSVDDARPMIRTSALDAPTFALDMVKVAIECRDGSPTRRRRRPPPPAPRTIASTASRSSRQPVADAPTRR